ncbi:MAG: LuxR C-terminal-related transcriptional regulator [Phycisphaerales bacterium]
MEPVPALLQSMFFEDPGVGFAVVDHEGIIRFANAKSAQLFLEGRPSDAIGKNIHELFGEAWAAERMRIFDDIDRTQRPVISRHIRHGRRIQSTIRPFQCEHDQQPCYLVITVEGEHEPIDGEGFEIVESELVHLGPLESLTRRELEVLALLGHGLNTAQIAQTLYRSPRTIERHFDSIRAKLKSPNRVQLAEFARRAGLKLEDAEKRRI